ncbi:PQQ-binding-like beta-propeller repeat protein [Streptomyces sp. NPDC051576]|uniref:outer membrane protein assembly factor BamB family protein n=1 Tax=Streptomyces sp. NPDC051576 TaxID=3155803 RepID=UPI00342E5CFB
MYDGKAPESVWRHSWWRRSARRLWTSPYEQGEEARRPLGLWLTDDSVVIARFDRVQAFTAATGVLLWTWRPPGGQIVRLVSADARDGVGVVLHHEDGGRDMKQVGLTSLALSTGEVVRHRDQDKDPLGYLGTQVALGGGLLATAAEFWSERPVLRALDPETGGIRWEHRLTDPKVESADVIGAQPLVASLKPRGGGARPRLLVLGKDGTEAVTLRLPDGYGKFGEKIAVAGEVLAVELFPDEESDQDKGVRLGAYSISSGELMWTWHAKGSAYAAPVVHRGWLLVVHLHGERLSVLDPADGRVVATRRIPGYAFDPFLAVSGDLITVSCTSFGDTHRLRTFRWR